MGSITDEGGACIADITNVGDDFAQFLRFSYFFTANP